MATLPTIMTKDDPVRPILQSVVASQNFTFVVGDNAASPMQGLIEIDRIQLGLCRISLRRKRCDGSPNNAHENSSRVQRFLQCISTVFL